MTTKHLKLIQKLRESAETFSEAVDKFQKALQQYNIESLKLELKPMLVCLNPECDWIGTVQSLSYDGLGDDTGVCPVCKGDEFGDYEPE